MNYLRTAILLAGLTALFMAIGFLIGGESGAIPWGDRAVRGPWG
jgi:heat shock protein HtpX